MTDNLSKADEELLKAIVNYRMECDLYWSDREQGVYTQEEYEDSIDHALNRVMQLIKRRDAIRDKDLGS